MWVLLIILLNKPEVTGKGAAIEAIEFETKRLCEHAREDIMRSFLEMNSDYEINVLCLEKKLRPGVGEWGD